MSATDSAYLIMLGTGLLGGLGHCSGMCGPVVASYSLQSDGQAGTFKPHILYNAGRITTYGIIGGLMGLTGSFAGIVQSIEKFQAITMAGIGTVMVMAGLAAAGLFSARRNFRSSAGVFSAISDRIGSIIRFIAGTRTAGAFYVMGMATGFIPCGLLYTAYIAAAGAGAGAASRAEGLLKGMIMLVVFGIGTTPALILIGRIAALRREWIRKRLYMFSALFMVLMGALFIYRAATY